MSHVGALLKAVIRMIVYYPQLSRLERKRKERKGVWKMLKKIGAVWKVHRSKLAVIIP
jgi:hypothetical protein